ncbi:UNVERIFIED_CONTAM: Calcyphosin [Trichonephila clavipes]
MLGHGSELRTVKLFPMTAYRSHGTVRYIELCNHLSMIDLPPTYQQFSSLFRHPHFRGYSFYRILSKIYPILLRNMANVIEPPLPQERVDIIERAFAKMDQSGDGSVTLEDLKGVYSGKEHPDVVEGKKSEDEVLLEFLANFDTPNKADGKVSKQEFIDYYAGVSASIDLDEYFVTMMEKAWQL